MPEIPLRPRTAPEIVDAAFVLARRHYAPLVTTAAIGAMATAVVQMLNWRSAAPAAPTMATGSGALLTMLSMALAFLAHGAGVAVAAEAYVGRRLDPGEAFARALRRAWPLFASGAYYMAMLFGGLALLIVPAVYVFSRYGVLVAVVMMEPLGPIASLRRTATLTEGRRWRVLATIGLAYLVATGFSLATQYLFRQIGGSLHAATLASLAVGVVLSPFYSAIGAALYYDLRIAREGFDLESLAAELEAADSAVPAVG
ncbi:MAG TPA: hypothetical protein VFJ74_03485 [Gemmatimonadaceae bacterium]|nr:hypothetical protein [Gemmatimonadaceae bacterium]